MSEDNFVCVYRVMRTPTQESIFVDSLDDVIDSKYLKKVLFNFMKLARYQFFTEIRTNVFVSETESGTQETTEPATVAS